MFTVHRTEKMWITHFSEFLCLSEAYHYTRRLIVPGGAFYSNPLNCLSHQAPHPCSSWKERTKSRCLLEPTRPFPQILSSLCSLQSQTPGFTLFLHPHSPFCLKTGDFWTSDSHQILDSAPPVPVLVSHLDSEEKLHLHGIWQGSAQSPSKGVVEFLPQH